MPQRLVRWVEGTDSPSDPLSWFQVKRFQGTLAGQKIAKEEGDLRNTAFMVDKKPAYTREQLQSILKSVSTLRSFITGIAIGRVVRWHYDGEAGIFWFDEEFNVGGEIVLKRRESTDRTLLEAGHAVTEALADMLSTTEKPISTHEIRYPTEPGGAL